MARCQQGMRAFVTHQDTAEVMVCDAQLSYYFQFYLVCEGVLPLCMFRAMLVPGACGDLQKTGEPLELELQTL